MSDYLRLCTSFSSCAADLHSMKNTICSLLIWIMIVVAISQVNTLDTIEERDNHLYSLWESYEYGSSSILDELNNNVYLETRMDMIGFLLFGAKNYKSFLRSVHAQDKNLDHIPCFKAAMELFEKRCGVLDERMKKSLSNICKYVSEKEAVEEAIIAVCAIHPPESHAIDLGNPQVEFTPAPIHGTSRYCGRVSIEGISRTKILSYANAFKITLVPSKWVPELYDNLIQVCFHRNASLGLCGCEKDDWRSLKWSSWSSTMSPYEQRYVDVEFVVQLSASVTVALDEVSQGWHYLFLIGGIALLIVAVSTVIFDEYVDPYVDDEMVNSVKVAMAVLALICIFMSSADTYLAMIASFCVAVIALIRALSMRTNMLPPHNLFEQGPFHNVQQQHANMNVAEFISSRQFEKWLSKNIHRYKLRPIAIDEDD